MNSSGELAKRDRTFWRGMYLIAFTIGVIMPIAAIIAVAVLSDQVLRGLRNDFRSGFDPVFLFFAWSAATFLTIVGMAAAVWIIVTTAEKLGIDAGRSYLRGMFLMAFATGALVPFANVVAAGVTTGSFPNPQQYASDMILWIMIVMWCGVVAVCLAGLFSAAWLVKSSVAKLATPSRAGTLTDVHEPHYADTAKAIR